MALLDALAMAPKIDRQERAAEQEGGEPERLALEARLDLHGVDAGPAQHHVLGAAPHAVGLAPLVELADAVDDRVLVAPHDEPRDLLRDPLGHRLERAELGQLGVAGAVAVEHLERRASPCGAPPRTGRAATAA